MKRMLKAALNWLRSLSGLGEERDMANAFNPQNWGVNDGIKTYKADAAITRYYLVKGGSDVNHVAVSAAANDVIFGVALDQAEVAEDPIAVFILGAARGTVPVVAVGALAIGAELGNNGNGTVKAAAGEAYSLGTALTASLAALDVIEMAPRTSPTIHV